MNRIRQDQDEDLDTMSQYSRPAQLSHHSSNLNLIENSKMNNEFKCRRPKYWSASNHDLTLALREPVQVISSNLSSNALDCYSLSINNSQPSQ